MGLRVYEGTNAIFELSGPCQKLFGPERKALIRACLTEGGEWFKAERIPLRFTDYAYRLGYRVTDDWKHFKRDVLSSKRAVPFIGITPPGGGDAGSLYAKQINGEKMAVAIQRGCRVDVTGTSKGGDIIIRTPFGHPIITPLAEAFKNVLPAEYQQVAQIVAASLNSFLAYARPPSARSKKLTIEGATDNWKPRGREFAKRDSGTIAHRK